MFEISNCNVEYRLDFRHVSLNDLARVFSDVYDKRESAEIAVVLLTDIEFQSENYILANIFCPKERIFWYFGTGNPGFYAAQYLVYDIMKYDEEWRKFSNRAFHKSAKNRAEKCPLCRAFHGITRPWGGPDEEKYCDEGIAPIFTYRSNFFPAIALDKYKEHLECQLKQYGEQSFRFVPNLSSDTYRDVDRKAWEACKVIGDLFRDPYDHVYTKEEIAQKIKGINDLKIKDWEVEIGSGWTPRWDLAGMMKYAVKWELQDEYLELASLRVEWVADNRPMMRLGVRYSFSEDDGIEIPDEALRHLKRLAGRIWERVERYPVTTENPFEGLMFDEGARQWRWST